MDEYLSQVNSFSVRFPAKYLEQGTEENIWTKEGRSDGWVEKTA
jgi:hypothetical protein